MEATKVRITWALDQKFEFVDSDSPKPGDYYFVRVKQLDGGMAWSSPIWVGGFSPRYKTASTARSRQR